MTDPSELEANLGQSFPNFLFPLINARSVPIGFLGISTMVFNRGGVRPGGRGSEEGETEHYSTRFQIGDPLKP